MFIGIRNDFLNATLCSSSVNEFNVQLLEWGVFFPGACAVICSCSVHGRCIYGLTECAALLPEKLRLQLRNNCSSARGWQIWAIVARWGLRWEIYPVSTFSPSSRCAALFISRNIVFIKNLSKMHFHVNELFMGSNHRRRRRFEMSNVVCFRFISWIWHFRHLTSNIETPYFVSRMLVLVLNM